MIFKFVFRVLSDLPFLLTKLWPFAIVLVSFIVFIYINDGIVLGTIVCCSVFITEAYSNRTFFV